MNVNVNTYFFMNMKLNLHFEAKLCRSYHHRSAKAQAAITFLPLSLIIIGLPHLNPTHSLWKIKETSCTEGVWIFQADQFVWYFKIKYFTPSDINLIWQSQNVSAFEISISKWHTWQEYMSITGGRCYIFRWLIVGSLIINYGMP